MNLRIGAGGVDPGCSGLWPRVHLGRGHAPGYNGAFLENRPGAERDTTYMRQTGSKPEGMGCNCEILRRLRASG
jgi:hypothetical protein